MSKPYRLAVVGSRACSPAQFSTIMRHLDHLEPTPSAIVTGDASGVDEAARFWSLTNIGPPAVHNAEWDAHGKNAAMRNAKVVADADRMIAFVCQRPSSGTEDAIRQAKGRGILVNVFDLTSNA